MQKVYFFLLSIALSCSVSAQNTYQDSLIRWQNCYGGSGAEYVTHLGHNNKILALEDGFIFTTATWSADYDVPGNNGMADIWVFRANSSGNVIWTKHYGGTGNDYPARIIKTSDGGFLIVGSSKSTNHDITNYFGENDVLVIKIDSVGTLEWSKNYGGSHTDNGMAAIECPEGYMIFSNSTSKDNMVSVHFGGDLQKDIWIFKIDYQGNLVWEKTFGGTSDDSPMFASITNDNKVIVCGSTSSHDYDFVSDPSMPQSFILKIDFNGNKTWAKTYGSPGGYEDGQAIFQINDAYYMVSNTNAGGTEATDLGDVSNFYGNTGYDIWLTKHDTSGAIIWDKSYGGSYVDRVFDMLPTSNNKLAIIGSTNSADFDVTNYHHTTPNGAAHDIWLFTVDLDGNFDWGTTINTRENAPTSCWGYSIAENNDVGSTENNDDICFYMLVAEYQDCDHIPLDAGKAHTVVMSMCNYFDNTTGIEENKDNKLAVYPNPANNQITIDSPDAIKAGTAIRVFDVLGKQLKSHKVNQFTKTITLDINGLAKGVYILSIGTTQIKFVVGE